MIANIKRLIKIYRRFLTYCLVGCINTIVDFLVFTLFSAVGLLSADICQALGYLSGVACSFLLNRSVTFKKDATTSLVVQIIRFVLVNAVSLVAGMLAINLLVNSGINRYIAKVAVTILVAIINYLGYKIFVFGVARKNKYNRGE